MRIRKKVPQVSVRLWDCGIRARVLLTLLAFTIFTGQVRRSVIVTSPELRVAPSTDKQFDIHVESGEPASSQVKLLVRGLAPGVSLSEGRVFGQGVWVVPLNDIPRLKVLAPADTSRSDLNLALVTLDGKLLAEARVVLFITPQISIDEQKPVAARPFKRMAEAERESAMILLRRGDQSIKEGNIAAAQQFYRRAADYGLAEAATALGTTYDPTELARMKAVGVRPDPALARQWYEKARELGAHDTDARVGRLP
jgi:hypothetical protein